MDEAEMGGFRWWNQLLWWRSPCGGLDKPRWVGKPISRPPGITWDQRSAVAYGVRYGQLLLAVSIHSAGAERGLHPFQTRPLSA